MVSREKKRSTKASLLHDKLQLLRSITDSHAMSETSIVVDASNYIKELKLKVERMSIELGITESSTNDQNLWPEVCVETLENGFIVNVQSGNTCPGLLVFILDTLEELGLNVLEARVSCAHSFHLQALGGESEEDEEMMDANMVKRAISKAIRKWSRS